MFPREHYPAFVEKLCNIYFHVFTTEAFIAVQFAFSPALHVITSEKIISHHILALSLPTATFFRDNLSKIFTSCLIKASEIRASSGKRHLQTA
jgi:hypothetical protein